MSVTDIRRKSNASQQGKLPGAAADEGDLRARLQIAALGLFRERGYDRTTASEIAACVGVTERTFFRYFPDKREVLFEGSAMLETALVSSIVDARSDLGPLDTLFHAFRSTLPMLEENRSFSKPRHEVISSTPALYERELAKIDSLTGALSVALKARGVSDGQAALAAGAGMAAFVHAVVAWLEDPEIALSERIDGSYRELKALLTVAT